MQNTHNAQIAQDTMLDEQIWAERFSQDIDQLLAGDDPALSEQSPADYSQMLSLGRALASPLDPVDGSLQQTLRQRLLSQSQPRRKAYQPVTSFWQRPFAFASLALVAFVLGGMLLTAPMSAWGASMMLGLQSLSATVIPTAAQTATATPSRTAVMPTAALYDGAQLVAAAHISTPDSTPVVNALTATAVPVTSGVLVTAVVR